MSIATVRWIPSLALVFLTGCGVPDSSSELTNVTGEVGYQCSATCEISGVEVVFSYSIFADWEINEIKCKEAGGKPLRDIVSAGSSTSFECVREYKKLTSVNAIDEKQFKAIESLKKQCEGSFTKYGREFSYERQTATRNNQACKIAL